MHSRIFQVSLNPINKEDYIEESNYYDHWFTNEIADYVDGDTDRDADIEWLKNAPDGSMTFENDENGEYFIVNSRAAYFQKAFETFKTALDKIKDVTIDDFAEGINGMWALKNAYEDKFGFYVDADGELMTMDSFVRRCAVGEKYYIGGTMDYHW